MLKKANSLTFRITLLFSISSVVVLLALGLLIRQSVNQHFIELDVAILNARLKAAKLALDDTHSPNDLPALRTRIERLASVETPTAVQLLDAHGKPKRGLGDERLFASFTPRQDLSVSRKTVIWQKHGTDFRIMSEAWPTSMKTLPTAKIFVGVDISHHEHFMAHFQIMLSVFVGSAAIFMGLLGWLAARQGLLPLKRIQQDTSSVSANNLDFRLSVSQLPVELAELGYALNIMLARLQDSFTRLSDFSADIAHELRTPVSNLMTQTQVALSRARSPDAYRDILASNAEELERMARMISEMLFLAKTEHGLMMPRAESISLLKEFEKLFSFYEALTEEKNITMEISGEADIQGDTLMLRRAFSNLLSNAIQHTPRGGGIRVVIQGPREEGDVWLSVENTGAIIPEKDIPRLFDRFYRTQPSRDDSAEGTGLGLAITRSIVQLHKGTIMVESKHGMTRFMVRLPVTMSLAT